MAKYMPGIKTPDEIVKDHQERVEKEKFLKWLKREAEPEKIEAWVDKGLRHRPNQKPFNYLQQWLYVARHFGYATEDDSWGEFEKLFAIIVKRMIIAERELTK